MDRAAVVVDLGFGDAGKGLITDYLARRLGARLVARFHGGAQAGHNVVTPDGRHHTFAQFGAATFVPGVKTHLSHGVVIHPTALLVEAAHLARAGVPDALDRLSVSERALVITPFHQAAGRLRELSRGDGRHGSCGIGFGETVSDALKGADALNVSDSLEVSNALTDSDSALRAADLRAPRAMRPALLRLQARKREELRDAIHGLRGDSAAEPERAILEDPEVVDRWIDALAPFAAKVAVVSGDWLRAELAAPGAVVLEGAQGVLLDEWAGFHPHTTWSTCTFDPALSLLHEHGFAGETARIGVLRTYAVRHGAGPLPTEDRALDGIPEPHNIEGPWQGRVRRGWPDLLLLRYALDVCRGADALALTHTDALRRLPAWRACTAYDTSAVDPALSRSARLDGTQLDGAMLDRIPPPQTRDLDRQAALGAALQRAVPVYEHLPFPREKNAGERAAAYFEERLCVPVCLASAGPCSADVRERAPFSTGTWRFLRAARGPLV